jgi:phosphoglycerol transferase MdoB-like AlkP superfamily enzyme
LERQTEADKINNKIEFARFINNHSLQLIGLLDTKTSKIVAINGGILTLLFTSKGSLMQEETLSLFQLVVGLLGASAICRLSLFFLESKGD